MSLFLRSKRGGKPYYPYDVTMSPDKANNIDIQSKSEIHKAESTSNPNKNPVEKFLSSCNTKGTMKGYRRGLELFIEFYSKPIEVILDERKDDLTPRPNENLVDAKNRASRFENILEEFHHGC